MIFCFLETLLIGHLLGHLDSAIDDVIVLLANVELRLSQLLRRLHNTKYILIFEYANYSIPKPQPTHCFLHLLKG